MKKVIVALIFFLIGNVFFVCAGEIKFKGFVQTWGSYVQLNDTEDSGYGFTFRRVRLTPYGNLSKRINWKLQLGWDKLSPGLIEAYIDFLLSDNINIRVGKYTVPGTISSSISPSYELDFIERPQVTLKWGSNNGLIKFRSLGVQVYGKVFNDKLYYAFMLSNPRTSSPFTTDLKSANYTIENWGIALWGRVEASIKRSLRLGAFFGTGKEEDTEIKRQSWGIHLFYTKSNLNVKFEYIAGEYGEKLNQKKYNGFYAVLGYRLKKIEPIIRYDTYSPENGNPDDSGIKKYKNTIFGINYFFSKNIKLQANFALRKELMAEEFIEIRNNLFFVCLQYLF